MRFGLGFGLGRGRATAIAPSLDLAFALDKAFVKDPAVAADALITSRRGPSARFTRTSAATQVNAQGLIEYAPENLLLRSEDFSNAGWTKTRSSIDTSPVQSPIGTLTAWKLIEDATPNATHYIRQSVGNSQKIGRAVVFSVYARAGERSQIGLSDNSASNFGSMVVFDLSGSGSIVSQGTATSASITAVGDGWFRCVAFYSNAQAAECDINIVASGNTIYTGDNSSGLFIWGAQLERFSTARTYLPTTSSAFHAPRFDHDPLTGECEGLLIEEQRINVLRGSSRIDASPWGASGSSTVSNGETAPDGSSDGCLVTTTAAGNGRFVGGISLASGTVYSLSCYFKAGTMNLVRYSFFDGSSTTVIALNLSTLVVSTFSGTLPYTSSVVTMLNGWYRFVITFTAPATTAGAVLAIQSGASGSFVAWGTQLEVGAFASSYTPTPNNGSATRSADVCSITGSDFTAIYNPSEGTLVADSFALGISSLNNNIASILDGSSGRLSLFHRVAAGSRLSLGLASGTTTPASGYNQLGTRYRAAASTSLSSSAFFINGAEVSGTIPTASGSATGLNMNGSGVSTSNVHLARVTYYKKRLPNAKLQSLTL